MKKSKTNHLKIQKKTISNLDIMRAKGGNPPYTQNELDSRCACRTDQFLCLQTVPYCTT